LGFGVWGLGVGVWGLAPAEEELMGSYTLCLQSRFHLLLCVRVFSAHLRACVPVPIYVCVKCSFIRVINVCAVYPAPLGQNALCALCLYYYCLYYCCLYYYPAPLGPLPPPSVCAYVQCSFKYA